MSKDLFCERLGQNLRYLRGDKTRPQVAREVGISYTSIQYYEQGKVEPGIESLLALCKYYNVSIEKLLEGIDD